MNQLSIFDIPAQPITKSPLMPDPAPITPQPQATSSTGTHFDLPCDVPQLPDCGTILKVGDRVVILAKKYSHLAHVPGIVKGFVWDGVVVQRRDGEGLYERKELHLYESTTVFL